MEPDRLWPVVEILAIVALCALLLFVAAVLLRLAWAFLFEDLDDE